MIQSLFCCLMFPLCLIAQEDNGNELKVKPEKENVVASRLEGTWQEHAKLSARLTGNKEGGEFKGGEFKAPMTLSFVSDPTIAARIPEKYVQGLAKLNAQIYMAGTVDFDGNTCPFVLTEIKGNPHVLFWLERDGDKFGNGESFNVMLAVAAEKENDLLFIGGDFNNQPFSAFERIENQPKK